MDGTHATYACVTLCGGSTAWQMGSPYRRDGGGDDPGGLRDSCCLMLEIE